MPPRRSGRPRSSRWRSSTLPDDALRPILKETLRDPDEQVRLAAVDLLVGRRPLLASLAPELEELLTAKDDGVARHAAFLLGQSGPDATPRLLDALRREESRIDPIAEALAPIGRPAVARLRRRSKTPSRASAAARPWRWGRSARWPREPCRS